MFERPFAIIFGALFCCGVVLFVACDRSPPKSKGGATSSGPDHVIRVWVRAMKERDPTALIPITRGELRLFYKAAARIGEIQKEVVGVFRELYPEEADDRRLTRMEEDWRRAVSVLENVQLVGRLPEASVDRRVYLVRFVDRLHIERDVEVVLRKDKKGWYVESWGRDTPNPAVIGYEKTQRNQLEYTYKPCLKAIRERHPRTLLAAMRLFSDVRNAVLKQGEPSHASAGDSKNSGK
ncbi:MAG TPA: hypothetical protein ENK43_00130 [Planctomycetes bacterium]|nr:hypothetical protein [Planctomycetota bacterium]